MRYDHLGTQKMEYVYLPNWVAPVSNRDFFFNMVLKGIRIGKNCTSAYQLTRGGTCQYIIIESAMVVPRQANYSNASYFFVHDDYVDAYKASSDWSSRASTIYPISSFREMFPNEPARMYEEW